MESRTILVPGGDLTFASTATYVENTARDTPKHRLEEFLNKIVVRWAVNVGRLPGERRVAEERAAKYAEEERLRQEQEVRRQRLRLDFADRQRTERERVEKLKQLAARWQESQQIRAYVAAVAARHQAVHDDDRSRWCDWAMKQADRLDPLVESQRSILDMTFEEYEQGVSCNTDRNRTGCEWSPGRKDRITNWGRAGDHYHCLPLNVALTTCFRDKTR